MKVKNYMIKLIPVVATFLVVHLFQLLLTGNLIAQTPEGYSTFHSIGIYWKPAEADSDNICNVSFREVGFSDWRSGHPLWFDPNTHSGLPERSQEYRGSLVDLVPGTNYEIELNLAKTGTKASFFIQTLDEDFKIKSTVLLNSGELNVPLEITSGGSETDGYVLYTSENKDLIIDTKKLYDYCVQINASYVILRGLTLKGALDNGILLGDVNHIVIEDCDISDWGSNVESGLLEGFGINFQSAIYSKSTSLSNVIIQRNKLHHPSTDANSWEEPVSDTHPEGPQGICFIKSKGFHIIRYNEIFSDELHKFNDGMGEYSNTSFTGFPNRDSDIYGNLVYNCWDDAIEAEGSGMNVRIWGNFIDTTYVAFGLASQSLGPLYLYRNITNFSQKAPYPIDKYDRGSAFAKIGCSVGDIIYSKGQINIFHNTLLQPPTPWQTGTSTSGAESGINYSSDTKVQENIVSRNNILNMREGTRSIKDPGLNETNDFNYDLYNGAIIAKAGSEANGIFGSPVFESTVYPYECFLSHSSLGYDAGALISNFNDHYKGNGPDMGALENELPAFQYGVESNWNDWIQALPDFNIPNKLIEKGIFLFYPNPVNDYLYIKALADNGILNLTVFDVTGKIIFTKNLSGFQEESFVINLSNWKKGVYFIRGMDDKNCQQDLFIVQ